MKLPGYSAVFVLARAPLFDGALVNDCQQTQLEFAPAT